MTQLTVFITSNTSWYLFNFRASTVKRLQLEGARVVCLSPKDGFTYRLIDELGVEHIPLPMDGKSTGIIRELQSLYFIWKVLRRYKPDYVFNFTVKLNVYGGLACRPLGIPFSNNISGLGTAFIHDSWLFRRVRQVYGYVNRSAQRLFFQNQEDYQTFLEAGLLGGTPVTVLPGSGVDLRRFAFERLPDTEPVTFLIIARLLGDKGVREYAKACRLIRERGAVARCLLLGPLGASNRTAIGKEEVNEWSREGSLEYLGETDDVRTFIRQSHVLVLPSYREGMPRTVLEAASMGRPAIVTDVPGCRQSIVPGETGWLCEVRNAESLAAQMHACIEMGIEQLQEAGQKARQRMEDEFSEEIVIQAYLDCLNAVKERDVSAQTSDVEPLP